MAVLVDQPSVADGDFFPARVGLIDAERIVLTGTVSGPPGDEARVTLRWCVESGERDVSVRVQSCTATTWTVVADGLVNHRQRRGWVRVNTTVPVRVRPLDQDNWLAGITSNVSVGGLAGVLDAGLPAVLSAGMDCVIELTLPDTPVTAAATIVSADPSEDGPIVVRAVFGEFTETAQKDLSGFVFQVQREELAERNRRELSDPFGP